MEYFFHSDKNSGHKAAFIIGGQRVSAIEQYYIDPYGLHDQVITFPTEIRSKRTPKAVMAPCWDELKVILNDLKIDTLIISDSDYFKHITKETKTEANLGVMVEAQGFKCFFVPNTGTVFYNPDGAKEKMATAMKGVQEHLAGNYIDLGSDIVHFSDYMMSVDYLQIENWLEKLHQYDQLTCDIETYSLVFHDGGLGSISFAWSKHEGIAFMIENDRYVKSLLKDFFINYKGNLVFHNASFDVTFLIYNLFMDGFHDQEGLQLGLKHMTKNLVCTMVITYLATNSCAGNELGLKAQAQEFAGNYAEDVTDITKIPIPKLLEYNLYDTLSTWFVFEKHFPTLIQDQQEGIYALFMKWMVDIIQMQLTGLPIDLQRVAEVKQIIQGDYDKALKRLLNNKYVKTLSDLIIGEEVVKYNTTRKVKRITRDDVEYEFNPGSNPQVSRLLYEIIGLPKIDFTKTKEPATGAKTLKKLLNHTTEPEVLELLKSLIEISDAGIMLQNFIPTFELAPFSDRMGMYFLYGSFKLGGTVSGRLSSSNPNLQNLPASSKYSKLIKSCFRPPEGWLFTGLDFDSLEDKISGLTTKDPNKLKVYTDGFDGHSLRAYSYFSEQMPDIDPTSVESINSISKKYPELRQDSKDPTFACTYGGTFRTMVRNLGWAEEKAREVENRYKELYSHSIAWVREKIEQATVDGYVTVAFGLRVRTPILKSTILNTRRTPFEAEAEGRTAGNALGQSYCMLNNRAVNELMEKVRNSEFSDSILPMAQIHDASYYLVRADAKIVKYLNDHLVKAVQWQELPEIVHDSVKLSGKLGIFYPDWVTEHTIPNNASIEDINKIGEDIADA